MPYIGEDNFPRKKPISKPTPKPTKHSINREELRMLSRNTPDRTASSGLGQHIANLREKDFLPTFLFPNPSEQITKEKIEHKIKELKGQESVNRNKYNPAYNLQEANRHRDYIRILERALEKPDK